MKNKALFTVMAILLVVLTLIGCGGVSQEDLDAAIAERDAAKGQVTTLQGQLNTAQTSLTAANEAKTKAETDLATAQAALTKANSDLASATSQLNASKTEVSTQKAKVTELEAKVAALEKEVADLKAAAGGGTGGGTTPPPTGFTGTKYSETTYGFSFQYPTSWTEKTASLTPGIIKQFGASPYYVPCIYVAVVDQSAGTNLEAAFKAYLGGSAGAYTFKSMANTTGVTIGGQACTKADIVYTGAYGDLDGVLVGFTKNNKWVLIGVVQYPALSASFGTATEKNDIVNSITFP
jgi:polyhydroxyalkanoate synthesis regulator phasin